MTERDDPTNEDPITSEGPTNVGPTGKRPGNDDAAGWFRAHVDPVVGGDVPDAWDEIQSRATGRRAILIPLPKAEARAWPGRRLVAVAALLLVVVGMVGIGMKLVGSDDDQRPAGGDDDGATGFYIPGQLPSGWEMTGLSIISAPGELAALECPCEVTAIRQNDAKSGYTTAASADSPSEYFGADAPRLRLDDRSGAYVEEDGSRTVVWLTATGSRSITSSSLNRTELEGLAEVWTSDEPPVLDGHHVVTTWTRDQPIERFHSTRWTFTNAESRQSLSVTMDPGIWSVGLLVPPTGTLPGNGLPFATLPDGIGEASVASSWPGNANLFAMSVAGRTVSGDQATPADRATIEAIIGSFQPADAAAWAGYLASAPKGETDPEAEPPDLSPLRTGTISDWLEGPEPGTALPKRTVQVVQNDPDDPSAAITVESNVDFVSVTEGEPFRIDLIMTNRTGATLDVSGCAFGGVIWSIIDEQGLVTPAGGISVDCDPGPYPWPDGEQRTRSFDVPGLGPMPDEGPIAAVIQYGDDLSQGVTVIVPGDVDG